jgi:hypothetical protein
MTLIPNSVNGAAPLTLDCQNNVQFASLADAGINPSTFRPETGSPVIGAAKDYKLRRDAEGELRPKTAAIGPLEPA